MELYQDCCQQAKSAVGLILRREYQAGEAKYSADHAQDLNREHYANLLLFSFQPTATAAAAAILAAADFSG